MSISEEDLIVFKKGCRDLRRRMKRDPEIAKQLWTRIGLLDGKGRLTGRGRNVVRALEG